jgi:hypothetical protein
MFSQLLLLVLHARLFLIFRCHALITTHLLWLLALSTTITHVIVGVFEMQNIINVTITN